MMNKRVEGSYVKVEDAMRTVQRLKEEGYSSSDIYVVANPTVRDSIPYTMNAEVSTDADMKDDDRSMWEKIKDAFTMDEYETDRRNQSDYNPDTDPLSSYRDEIEQGYVVVLVDKNAKLAGTNHQKHSDSDDTIELREERLDIDKDEVQTGEVRIQKRVVEEIRNIEVPVTHEELTIERRPVTDQTFTVGPITDVDETEDIVIPILEEQINVIKHTEVIEEVTIHKNKVTENKQVTDTVRKEELEVEHEGDITIDDHREEMTSDTDSDTNTDYPL